MAAACVDVSGFCPGRGVYSPRGTCGGVFCTVLQSPLRQ